MPDPAGPVVRIHSIVRRAALLLAPLLLPGCADGSTDVTLAGLGLTRSVPPIVHRVCTRAAAHTRIPVTCPGLVPRSRYVTFSGLYGVAASAPNLWELTSNNGDNGPGYVHWMVGAGSRGDVRFHVLGDERNVLPGLPKRRAFRRVDGRIVVDYRFPDYPAGGPNGSHAASFVSCGDRYVFASLHGWERMAAAERMALDLARRAGCPADPPPGPERLRTMPAPAGVAYACDRLERAETRRRARWRVVCPPVVPWSRTPHVDYAGGVRGRGGLAAGYALAGTGPPDGAASPSAGRWTFASGDPAAVHAGLRDAIGSPEVRVERSTAGIAGQRVAIYRPAPGTAGLAGHVVVEWTFRGQAYRVGVHGRAGDRQGLVQARAMATALVEYLRHD